MGASGLGYRQILGRFYARLEAVTAADWAPQISFLVDTDQASEEYKWLGWTPPLREWIGGREAKGFRESGIIIRNRTYEATLDVNVDELRRDKTGQILVRVDELADRVAEHWSKLLSALIETPGLCYDGQDFFDTDHSEGASGTQINSVAAAQVAALNIATATAPTIVEFKDAILGVLQWMLAFKDDQGEPMNAMAKSFLIMVPTSMLGSAVGAIQNDLLQGSSATVENTIPKLVQRGYSFEVVANPRLTGTTVWYMFRTDAAAKPFIRQNELFETGMEDQKFLNNRQLFGVKAIRNVGCGYWQYATKNTFS